MNITKRFQTGSVLLTLLVNILPKNEIPVVPPGIFATTVQSKETTCPTAQRTVSGVLCKCSAQYNVAVNVPPYVNVSTMRSLENMCLTYANGPQKKQKLKTINESDMLLFVSTATS